MPPSEGRDSARLQQGFCLFEHALPDGQKLPAAFWHVWLTRRGRLYDTGREVYQLFGDNLGADVRYSLQPAPGVHRYDRETEEERKASDFLVANFARVREDDLASTYWDDAPESHLEIRAALLADFRSTFV